MKAITAFNVVACGICMASGYLVYEQLRQPALQLPRFEPLGAYTAQAEPTQQTIDFRMPAQGQFSQLVSRPPFTQSRRPSQAKPRTSRAPARPITKPQLSVVGIVIKPEERIALVRKQGRTEIARLKRGERVEGWLVEGILPDRVLLSHHERLLEIELREAERTLR